MGFAIAQSISVYSERRSFLGVHVRFQFICIPYCHAIQNRCVGFQIQIVLTKCKDHVSTNTCENFQTWRFNKNVCQFFFNNKMWSKFQDNVSPRPDCPSVPVGSLDVWKFLSLLPNTKAMSVVGWHFPHIYRVPTILRTQHLTLTFFRRYPCRWKDTCIAWDTTW